MEKEENREDDRDKEGGNTKRTQEMKKDRTRKIVEWKKEVKREMNSRAISEQRR